MWVLRDPSNVTEPVITGTLAAFGIEQWEIYSQSKVPVVIIQVQAPVLGLFYLSMIYNKYLKVAGFAFCSKIQCK